MSSSILGISAYYHDSAAALLVDGQICAAAQEERFTRIKHDPAFPVNAIEYCLKQQGKSIAELDYIIFYDKPLLKFERLLETYVAYAPRGISSFIRAIPVWLKEKLFLKKILREELCKISSLNKEQLPPLLFNEHHRSHAASAFYPSPFDTAAVLCLDGVGEWATSSVWLGEKHELRPQWEIDFPHSLGLLYSAFTYYCGFKVNSGEYKLMGLAPYGEPVYANKIFDQLLDVKDDGTFRLDMSYFNYATGLTMTNAKFHSLFGGPPRLPESPITQREMDIARSIQVVTEEIVLKICASVHSELGIDNLCLAGGVALNCVANGRILRESPFKNIWVQPASGDAGGALGAAYTVWHDYLKNDRVVNKNDHMQGSYLGPDYKSEQISTFLGSSDAQFEELDEESIILRTAKLLAEEKVIGWFSGRMEYGPRALGARSILGDPRSSKMQTNMNLKIKYRESFRPFAPAVITDRVSDWFDLDTVSPYMTLVAYVREDKRNELSPEQLETNGLAKLTIPRSEVPAVTHVDFSARIQTVHADTNPRFYKLIEEFERITGCPILVNTSFNIRGEPIVCTPGDAYRCFMRTDMDYLVVENFMMDKKVQPDWKEESDWKQLTYSD